MYSGVTFTPTATKSGDKVDGTLKGKDGALGAQQRSLAAEVAQRRPSADGLLAPKTQPLHVKLDKFLRLLIGIIGIRMGGHTTHKKQPFSFIPKYLSNVQLKTIQGIEQIEGYPVS